MSERLDRIERILEESAKAQIQRDAEFAAWKKELEAEREKREAEAQAKAQTEREKWEAEREKRDAEREKREAEAQAKRDAEREKRDAEREKREAEAQAKRDADFERWKKERKEREAKLDEVMSNLAKQIGNYTDIESQKYEKRYAESLTRMETVDGIHYDNVEEGMCIANKDLGQVECDIIMRNDTQLFLIEVKHHPKMKTFNQLFKQRDFLEQAYPRYKGNIRLGIAAEVIQPKVLEKARSLGIYILEEESGELRITSPNQSLS